MGSSRDVEHLAHYVGQHNRSFSLLNEAKMRELRDERMKNDGKMLPEHLDILWEHVVTAVNRIRHRDQTLRLDVKQKGEVLCSMLIGVKEWRKVIFYARKHKPNGYENLAKVFERLP